MQPSRGFDKRLSARRGGMGGSRARVFGGGLTGMVVAVQVCAYGSPRVLQRGSPWGRSWRMEEIAEERSELVRRAGVGGMG